MYAHVCGGIQYQKIIEVAEQKNKSDGHGEDQRD